MANTNAPWGLRAITDPSGTTPIPHKYTAAGSIALYPGQIVQISTAGDTIEAATTTGIAAKRMIGVMSHYLAAATVVRDVWIYDNPEQEYEAQMDAASVTIGIGLNYVVTSLSAASTTTKQSTAVLDASSGITTTSYTPASVVPVKMKRYSPIVGQNNALAYARVICKLNGNYHVFISD